MPEDLRVPIDNNVPLPGSEERESRMTLVEKARAAANAAEMLEKYGLKTEKPTEEDRAAAAAIVNTYAADPEKAEKTVTTPRLGTMSPSAVKLTRDILDTFGHAVVDSSLKVRHMVVNKLIQETENDDARIRLRALELLGKMSDVGLFTEKSEVTITHQTSEDLRASLREKLTKMKDVTPGSVEDAEILDNT
jgi:hypothetical protein